MNSLVFLFFLNNVVATLLLGAKFVTRRDSVVKNFGVAFLFCGIAFAVWSAAVLIRPTILGTYVTIGGAFFIIAMIAFLNAGIQNIKVSSRRIILGAAIIMGALLFYTRTWVFPSAPGFSEKGMFFFNVHPIMQMTYVFALALTALPAIGMLASKFKSAYATIIHYGLIAEFVGGVLLITSIDMGNTNSMALYLTGWVIGIVYFLLWTIFLFSRKAWEGVS